MALTVDTAEDPWVDVEVTGPTHESDALRLRRALHRLRLNLQEADSEVIEMLEEWQETTESCEKAQRKAVKLRAEADELDADAEWTRQKASYLFQIISAKLATTAHNVHMQTAPFVQVADQQALQLQCYMLIGRKWRTIRLKLGEGLLVYTRVTRSLFTRRQKLNQVSIELGWIESTRAEGDVLINMGLCAAEARWQWACVLNPLGREHLKANELIFCCESVHPVPCSPGLAALADHPRAPE